MFDALEELEARDEDPGEAQSKYWHYGIALVVSLTIFVIIGLAMWRYHG